MGAYVDSIKTSDGTKHPIQDNTIFEGTQAEWDLLTSEQKATYRLINITDDYDAPYEEPEIWGFIEHMNILDPTQRIEYIKTNKNYTPLTIDANTHTANYGSWSDNPILQANVPAMIKSDGTVDYYLDPDDYTKKLDGTASDITDETYDGGAFAYIPKVYSYTFIRGNDRYVMFSMTKVNNNYKAIGFTDYLGNEYDGMWIPMFYGIFITQNNVAKILSLATGTPSGNTGNTDTQKSCLENGISSAKFFGGPIINVLNDLLILFAKNSNLELYGYGNSVGSNGVLANTVVNGGQFYGTSDGSSLNKVFHSLIPITCQINMRDPYTLLFEGRLKVSPGYYYDLTAESEYFDDTELDYPTLNGGYYTRGVIIPDYGFMPYPETPSGGSSSLAYGDVIRTNSSIGCAAMIRFGNYTVQHANGPMNMNMSVAPGTSYSVYGCAPMVFGAASQGGA